MVPLKGAGKGTLLGTWTLKGFCSMSSLVVRLRSRATGLRSRVLKAEQGLGGGVWYSMVTVRSPTEQYAWGGGGAGYYRKER